MPPKDESKQVEDLKKGCLGCLPLLGIFCLFVGCVTVLFPAKKQTPEEKISEWYSELAPYSCEQMLKEKLRDPDSYRKSGDHITGEDTGTEKTISWEFRAKNGFGGYNSSTAVCKVSKQNGGSLSVSFAEP